ncbi:MAG: xanthine dehydrogenase family protein molybdopterin-binding subunit, partial [Alphaproteobacteria bacterium]
ICLALSGADLGDDLAPIGGGQVVTPKGWQDRVEHRVHIPPQPIMPAAKAHYVGEALAVIVADNRYIAEDAARAVALELEPLPVVPNCEAGLAENSEILHPDLGTNLVGELGVEKGNATKALAAAPRRIKRRFIHHRYAAMPMECRGVLAQYDRRTDSLTVWSSTQVVHWIRRELGRRLGLAEDRIRVIAPDVGGGFGGKGHVYPEDLLIPYLAMRLGRPVMWIEDRIEHFQNSAHSRDTVHEAEIGFEDDGRITALDVSFIIDSGAYSPVGAGIAFNTIAHHIGPYEIPNFRAKTLMVVTNRTPNAPYRGAGRPEAAFVTERLIDLVANELGMEPADVRRRNMIRQDQMPYEVGLPYRDGVPMVYDGGDYPAALDRALEALGGLAAFRERQAAARTEGRWLGIGMASYTEGTGVGPFEGATVRVDPTGKIAIAAGACPHGQGHRTVLAQVAADGWSVPMDDVVITLADTSALSAGYGTIASRSAVTASAAIIMASDKVKEKVIALAAHLLETPETDLEFREGTVGVKGVPNMALSLREIAAAGQPGWDGRRPEGMEGGLEATAYFEPPTVTWTYATNAVIVEIDPETGEVSIERYVAVHDAGVLINPMIAEAQVVGGLVQGIGGGMMEELVYGDDGQLLTSNLADYVLPTAVETPPITVVHTETPSPLNPLGVKGLGEGGAIAPPVAIANAVCDALKPLNTEINATPVRPADIVREFLKGD